MSRSISEFAPAQGSLSGKTALVTGANGGIGFHTSRYLCRGGAQVLLACRSKDSASSAMERIRREIPGARMEFVQLDLADLSSVRRCAETVMSGVSELDLLINNAGVMMPAKREVTADGFELHIGVNHLGHYALSARLLPVLRRATEARIVTVSSLAHHTGSIRFDDLHWEKRAYRKWLAYSQSKLANLLFTYELSRRLKAASSSAIAVSAHPGWTGTDLQRHMSLPFVRLAHSKLAMSAERGALPIVFAATSSAVASGECVGPDGLREIWGWPKVVEPANKARNPRIAETLWSVSAALTDTVFANLDRR